MTDLVPNFNISLNKPGQEDLEQLRVNFKWLFGVSLLNGIRDQKKCIYAPGWTPTIISNSSPADYAKPDRIEVAKTYTDVSPQVTHTYRFDLTWTGDNLTQIVWSYSEGDTSPLFTVITNGTITISYDGSGNMTGASTA